ncbi:MAG TPA: hypothetical protein VKH42_11695 [Vicinamibacterales bacterium]|nr:hypothetical protein [Vicinamibacterales bacterium]
MNRAAAITGVVAAAGIAVVAGVHALHKTDSSFSLQKDNAGVCRPSDPDGITAGWKNKVKWVVRNVDCPPQYVSLRNFKHPIGGGQYDPPETIFETPQVDGGPIPTAGTETLSAKVDKFVVWPKDFKYEIWLGESAGSLEQRRDPDIELWPF